LSFLALLLLGVASIAAAFHSSATTAPFRRPTLKHTPVSSLRMSDVPQEDKSNNNNKSDNARRKTKKDGGRNPQRSRSNDDREDQRRFFRLPPPPEDYFVLVGDVLALSVYSFSDHFVCQDLAQFFLPSAGGAGGSASASSALNQVAQRAPVWLDATHSYSDHVMNVLLRDATVVHYSPLLQPMGLAATVLASSWLLSGYLNEAFAYRNTLECSTPRTLLVTARSWVVSSLIVMTLVALTSNSSPEHWWQAFTIGDIDYIWDSLTVLCVWRYMASSLLGSGGSGGDDDTGGW
jgi:hypothetical protein